MSTADCARESMLKTPTQGAWAPQPGRGRDGLVKRAIKGKGGMPPRGGLSDIAYYEVARNILVMANQSWASFKEPAAPKAAAKR